MPLPGRRGEALVSEQFAEANGLALGDTLGALIDGRWERLTLVGVALSPEYVYAVQGGGAFLTDTRRFGVLWMEREALAAAYDMRGAFNDVALGLAPGAGERDVIARVDRLLARYGGLGAYGRADQPSHRVISDEIRQNRATGTVIPALILAVAAFLLNVVLARLVATEREQIAVLKAFGYTSAEVARHYLLFALCAVLLGAALGIAAGLWLGDGLVGLYAEHFRFPDLRYRASWPLVLAALGVSVAAAAAGALGAVRRAAALPPAEAMRPEAPARFGRGAVERMLPRGSLSPIGTHHPPQPGAPALPHGGVRPGRGALPLAGLRHPLLLRRLRLHVRPAVRGGAAAGRRPSPSPRPAAPASGTTWRTCRGWSGWRRSAASPSACSSGHRTRQVALMGMEPRPGAQPRAGPPRPRAADPARRPAAQPRAGEGAGRGAGRLGDGAGAGGRAARRCGWGWRRRWTTCSAPTPTRSWAGSRAQLRRGARRLRRAPGRARRRGGPGARAAQGDAAGGGGHLAGAPCCATSRSTSRRTCTPT